MQEEPKRWFEKAEKDSLTAKINLEQGLFEASAFFSHQSAEKALKSVYIQKFQRLWKIHDLTELGKKIAAPDNILRICDALNPHYIATRYPLDIFYTKEMAEEAFEGALEVIRWVKTESINK